MRIEGTEGSRDGAPSAEQGRATEGRAEERGDGLADIRADGRVAAKTVAGRSGPLRVDAQRNLRLVLSAARDVFGEQGYGAPMEEVARRARVGVGTVYRRFPNKEALVRHIAEEETQRLTASAREALALDGEPWGALEGFVQRSAAAGTGRLLPPELLAATTTAAGAPAASANGEAPEEGKGERGQRGERGERVPQQREIRREETRELLSAVGQLVERTRAAGELRADVTVADLMLVIATTPPRFEDPARRTAAGRRLLEILLQGLRRPDADGHRAGA
ncbi:helix-turn-helix domain-containing protein [Streptomyces sp. 6N223]|uniref:helix-turn-helix domain-containing protein n=1 Tax=Streptomyces sp. 6N223 TaxID=3457412 RepID=UPI003FD44966